MRMLFVFLLIIMLAQHVEAQSFPTVNLAGGILCWSFATNGDPLGGFHVNCTNIGPEALPPVVHDVTTPETRCLLLASIPVLPGTWSCTLDSYNDTEISAMSDPITFQAQNCEFR